MNSRVEEWPKRSPLQRLGDAIDRHLILIFLAPGILLLLFILTYPVIWSFALSGTDANLIFRRVHWVGWANFRSVLGDTDFWRAGAHSVVWTFGSIALQLGLGLIAALMLDRSILARGLFRSIFIIPYAFPSITIALLWRWMLNPLYGIYNYTLMWLGVIHNPVDWFLNPNLAMATAILINVWFGFPLMMLTIVAALQTIPRDYYEVAQIEGASYFQILRRLILPSISKVIAIMVVLRTIWVFNGFDLLFMLTGGGPVNSTETLPLYVYRTGWKVFQMGRVAAVSVILFGLLSLLIAFFFYVMKLEESAE
jgi:multiple sugar transport system permease protein